MATILEKIRIFLKSIQILKNWYTFPLVYYNIIKSPYVFLVTRDNFRIKLRNFSSDVHIFAEIWLENSYLKQIKLENNSVIIDVGAHIGLFSIYCKKMCNPCWIYCYEPEHENFEILNDNVKLNKISNISLNELAVSPISGLIKFYKGDDSSSHSYVNKSEISQDIQSIKLDEIFENNKIEKCHLLKLDCEGAEYGILLSTSDQTLKKIKQIILEYHIIPNQQSDLLKELHSKLQDNNFVLQETKINEKSGYLYAINNKQLI